MSLAWHLNSSKTLVFVPRWHWACYLPRGMGTVHRSLLQDLQGDQRMGRSFDLLSEGRESPGQHPKPWGAQLSGVSAWVQWVFRGGGGLLPLSACEKHQPVLVNYNWGVVIVLTWNTAAKDVQRARGPVALGGCSALPPASKQRPPSVLQLADLINSLDLCFALLRVEGHQSSQWEAFLVKGLWNITSTLQECFLWKTNVFVLLSMHLGNLQCGSKPSSTSCGQPAPRSASSQVSAEVMEGTY